MRAVMAAAGVDCVRFIGFGTTEAIQVAIVRSAHDVMSKLELGATQPQGAAAGRIEDQQP